jgi:ubiquinol-cytochrome c reductase iron-sulfur subunit
MVTAGVGMSDTTLDPQDRRQFLIEATVAAGAIFAGATAYPFLASMAPSERAKAAGAPVEADVAGLRPGEMKTILWRGKPVWLLRRTQAMLAGLSDHNNLLADPNSSDSQQPRYCDNIDRSSKAGLFVCVGVCTHLGCSPTLRIDANAKADLGASWPGGFFCPCHGSKFDLAGRVFKGVPAPTNLVIPPYRYLSDTKLVIGEDQKT